MRHCVRGLEKRPLPGANLSDCRRKKHRFINREGRRYLRPARSVCLGPCPSAFLHDQHFVMPIGKPLWTGDRRLGHRVTAPLYEGQQTIHNSETSSFFLHVGALSTGAALRSGGKDLAHLDILCTPTHRTDFVSSLNQGSIHGLAGLRVA